MLRYKGCLLRVSRRPVSGASPTSPLKSCLDLVLRIISYVEMCYVKDYLPYYK